MPLVLLIYMDRGTFMRALGALDYSTWMHALARPTRRRSPHSHAEVRGTFRLAQSRC